MNASDVLVERLPAKITADQAIKCPRRLRRVSHIGSRLHLRRRKTLCGRLFNAIEGTVRFGTVRF